VEFLRFLRTGNDEDRELAVEYAEKTLADLSKLSELVQDASSRGWLAEASTNIEQWVAQMEHTETLQAQRNELIAGGLDVVGPKIASQSSHIIHELDDLKKEELEHAQAVAQAAKVQMVGVSAVTVMIGAGLAFFIVRGILKNLNLLESRLQDIAEGEGDLTKRVDIGSRDEIGRVAQWFNQFVGKIEQVVAEVKAGAAQIDSGGTQIASASQSLAQGASEQASSLQQISASIEEISGQTQQSAENARQANTLAEESKSSADRGQQEMAAMAEAVNEIKQSSSEISNIIKVIDEIAFQTNLLALNAAVEAARAGEAGKGFAVVAEEVRNLAQRSAEAAKNTATMIEASVKRSENGVQIAGRVGQALQEITTSTNKVNTLLSEIASAASEQATGIGQINQGVSQLDQVTQQNAGNSEEMASSAEELSSQVASLNELVAQFKVSGGSTSVRPAKTGSSSPKSPVPSASNKSPARGKPSAPVKPSKPSPEELIPMDEDEVLASF
jgi:methyl-accepting chemotaxis protein